MVDELTCFVKCKADDEKSWSFLGKNGTTRLRIHAMRFTLEGARRLIIENAEDNPEFDFKVVRIDGNKITE